MSRRLLILLFPILVLALAACGHRTASTAPPPDLVIRVRETGLVEIAIRDLKAFGWDVQKLEGKRITLWRGDQEIPYQRVGEGDDARLRFFAQVTPTRFDDRAAFILRAEDGPPDGVALAQAAAERLADAPLTTFTATVRVEENRTYLAQVRDGDPWLGPRLFAPGEIATFIDTPAPAGGGRLRVRVWAATAAPGDIDHRLVFTLNGQALGENAWDGNGPHEIELPIPAGALHDGDNALVITAPGDTGAPADLVYLDWAEIAYARAARAEDERLLFETDAREIAMAGFGEADVEVWEVSDPTRPRRLGEGWAPKQGVIAFRVTEPGPHRLLATSAKGMSKLDALALAPPPLTAPEGGADYIIIAHPSLAEAIQPLAAYRWEQGLRTVVVTTDQIYQRFNRGMQSPDAITDFLRWAVATWPAPPPRFVLLAGDASYDPLNYLDAPFKNLVPGAFVATIELGETISDNAMADIDGDGWQDLAIGRFPAQTPEEVQVMVKKTLAFESGRPAGAWIDRMLFVADNDDPYFNQFNQDLIAMIPAPLVTENLVIDPNQDTRGDLLARLNQGRGLVSYMGHGAIDIWAQEEILKNEDVLELHQEGRLGVFLVWACLNGYFQHPSQRSLGEMLLITPDKGAVAGLFPTGQTFPNVQGVMADALFGETLFDQPTIGEAFMNAARSLHPELDDQRDVINTFLLLGDPALVLPWRHDVTR